MVADAEEGALKDLRVSEQQRPHGRGTDVRLVVVSEGSNSQPPCLVFAPCLALAQGHSLLRAQRIEYSGVAATVANQASVMARIGGEQHHAALTTTMERGRRKQERRRGLY